MYKHVHHTIGGSKATFEISFVLKHLKIWIMSDQNLFTELKKLLPFLNNELAIPGCQHAFSQNYMRLSVIH